MKLAAYDGVIDATYDGVIPAIVSRFGGPRDSLFWRNSMIICLFKLCEYIVYNEICFVLLGIHAFAFILFFGKSTFHIKCINYSFVMHMHTILYM